MRTPAIAGSWYPNSPAAILEMLGKIEVKEKAHPAVVMLPHAGYQFSGAVAARCLAKVNADDYEKIIILAPSHHAAMYRTFSVEPAGEVLTPFGRVEFTKELHDELEKLPGSKFTPSAHPVEHAIDIQLPLVRHFFPRAKVGAMIVGQWDCQTKEDIELLRCFGKAFRGILDEKTLVIISTDFTHFGTNYGYTPFTSDVANRLPKLDSDLFDAFSTNDNNAWAKILHNTGATVCGASCMHLVLAALPQKAQFEKLEYFNSALVVGDWNNAVGYTTAMIFADWQDELKSLELAKTPLAAISEEAGETLTKIAEYSLRCALFGKEKAGDFKIKKTIYDELQKPCGAFVTLTKYGQLRGCIGEIIANRPVLNVVYDRAVSAALNDTRFNPVTPDEFGSLQIEVSVLSQPAPIAGPEDIVIGRDGVILQKYNAQAVFLPQVAPEQCWDVPTMLTHLALKAGLGPDDWKEGCKFFTFQAQIFHQKKDYYSI